VSLIDRLRCSRPDACTCTEPEEAWICRYSRLIAKTVQPGERPVLAKAKLPANAEPSGRVQP
jgi:hypothetical protein